MPDFWSRMERADPAMAAKATALRDHVFADGALPRRTKELIYLEAIKLLWRELWPDLPAPTGQ